MSQTKLTDLMDALVKKTDGEVSIGDIVEKFESRGFGPLLLFPALIAFLPTGAIPGVPSICGLTLFMICMQITFGRKHPWLPAKLKNRSISHQKLKNAVDKSRPWAEKIETFLSPRLTAIASAPLSRITALFSGIVALCMMPLEALPFAVMLPAFAILVTAMGITSRDGLVVIIGLVLQGSTGFLLYKVF